MKKFLLLFLLATPAITNCQTPAVQFDLSKVSDTYDTINTSMLEKRLSAIAFIDADGQKGQGLFVGKGLLVTSLALVSGKHSVMYNWFGNAEPVSITDYIAADPATGLILLKVSKLDHDWVHPNGMGSLFPTYQKYGYVLTPVTSALQVAEITIPSREPELRNEPVFTPYTLSPISHKENTMSDGQVAFFPDGRAGGLIVHKDQKPFLASVSAIRLLLFHEDLNRKSIRDLSADVTDRKKQTNTTLYEVGLKHDRVLKGSQEPNDRLTLNYVRRQGDQLSFYFAFTPLKSYRSENFDPTLQMVDLETGMLYMSSPTKFKSNRVFTSTTYLAALHFANVPPNVNRVSFFNIPPDISKYESDLRMGRSNRNGSYFTTVIINNYKTVKKPLYNLEQNGENEGTVAFYLLKNSNVTGTAMVYVNGKKAGELDRYYERVNEEGFCGLKATVTLRLRAGEYKYKAMNGSRTIERKFRVLAGECENIQIKF